MKAHYEKMLLDTDERVKQSLKAQVRTPGETFGGFQDKNGIIHAKYTIYRVTSAIAAFCNHESRYYRDETVFRLICDGLSYVASQQHENGLFDLVSCNFFSAPDTAFCVKRMMPYLRFLQKEQGDAQNAEIYRALYAIVEKAAKGLLLGGFHTPNHRWAIASQLMECGDFFGNEEMLRHAQLYLQEGIDCNEDGEFAEKSAGNYNRINNDAMITMGNLSGDPTFFSYAVRNLRMMMTYMEPDKSIFTGNSTRQDNGKLVYPKDYYMEYLEMGIRCDIPEFLDMANYIFELIEEKGITSPDQMIHYMNHPDWIALEHTGTWVQPCFNRFYRESGIVRAHRDAYTVTLMVGKSGFLHYSTPTMHAEMKIGGSFCEHRAFVAQTLEELPGEEGYVMEQVMKGWYYLPLKEKPETSDWWKMDHSQREKLTGPDLAIRVEVRFLENGISLTVKTSGVTGAPLRLETALTGAELAQSHEYAIAVQNGSSMVLKAGTVTMGNAEECLHIGPGFGTHLYTAGKFGSEARSPYAYTLYCTDATPFEHEITLTSENRSVYAQV